MSMCRKMLNVINAAMARAPKNRSLGVVFMSDLDVRGDGDRSRNAILGAFAAA